MSHRPALTMVANSTKASQSLLLAPLLLLLLLTVTPLLSSAQEILTDEDIETFENTVLKGKFDSEAVDYYSSQAPAAVVLGIAIALLCFVGTVVFVFVRFYYCCCHKKTKYEPKGSENGDSSSGQNKDAGCGYFCWEGGESREGQHVSRGLKLVVILVSAGVVLGCALSVWGVIKFTVAMRGVKNVTLLDHGVASLFDLLSRVEDVVEGAIDTVGDYQLEGRSFESAFEAENASTSILDNVRQPVNDGVEYVEGDVNSVAELALIVINAAGVGVAALVAGLALMGMLGTINGGRWSTACSICVVPMWLVSAWIVFAVFSIGHKVFDVVCTELEVVAGCQANSTDASLCEESYTWGALNDFWIDNLNLNEVSRDMSVEIQRVVTERGNEELDHLYSSVCDAVEQLNNSTTSHQFVKVSEDCSNGTALLPLCERITPPTADDNTTTTPIISLTYDNQSRCAYLSEFNASFADAHCAEVPDTIAALGELLVSNDPNYAATAWLDEPPPVLMCMEKGRIIGSEMFQNMSNLAINSSTLLGELDSQLDALKLKPLRVVVELLAYTDCPATLDALYLLYVAYALIGVFLILCSISWIVGMYREQSSVAVAPEGGGTANNASRNGGDGGRHDNNGGTFNGTLENLHEGLERINRTVSKTGATVNEAGKLVDTGRELAANLLPNSDPGEDEENNEEGSEEGSDD